MSTSSADSVTFKITYLGFVAGHGGDALQMLSLAHGMRDIGVEVEIIVPTNEETGRFVDRCAVLGVPARRTDQISVTGAGSRQRLRSLLSLLRSLDSDVLHIHAGDSCLPRKMMLALACSRRRFVVATLHNPYPFIEPGGARARLWAALARRTLRAVVSPSEHGTRFQRECGIPARLAVTVRNSIDHLAFSSGDPRVPQDTLGLDEHVPIVLFSSRLDQQKRPLDAVRAFAQIARNVPLAVLVFVGSGDLQDEIFDEARRLGVEDRLKMAGYRTNIADWLAAATVWIFPTERENFSLALLEALAAGCAIAATECPGNDEIIVDGSNALTFAVGDVEGAAGALNRLLMDPELRQRLSVGARSTARSHTVAQMVEEYRRTYGLPPIERRVTST